MNILLVNTYDKGGAANACMRLHEGLLEQGVSSKLLILFSKNSYPENGNISVFSKEFPHKPTEPSFLKKAAIKLGIGKKIHTIKKQIEALTPEPIEAFSSSHSVYDFTMHPWYKEADIIHLHWASGFLDYSFFTKNHKPVVWTLHDMNPFTGGCHYSNGCTKFTTSCNNCPYLQQTCYPNYSESLLRYKSQHINKNTRLKIVAPSKWLANTSQSSKLFKHFEHNVIPYGIKSEIFPLLSKTKTREELGLPLNKKILLFVAERVSNKRKGAEYIFNAMEALKDNKDIVFCVVGKQNEDIVYTNLISLGIINDNEKLAKVYNAADALLVPSIEDNLPNTALESILCGTPVIAFTIGGLPDIIKSGENGYLAKEVSKSSFVDTINLFLSNNVSHAQTEIHTNAVLNYDSSVSAKRYISLYNSLKS